MFDANVFHFFSEMEDIKLLINYGGHWKGIIYKDSYLEVAFVYRNLTYEDLLSRVNEIVCADLNSSVYKMKSLLNTTGKIARSKIKK